MIWRALFLLIVVAAGSIALTLRFDEQVLLALGLILTQVKFLWGKLLSVDWGGVLQWVKSQSTAFARVELLKKWFHGSIVPLMMGSVLRRRMSAAMGALKDRVTARYRALWGWYQALEWYEKLVATLILVFAMLALSVSTLGLWLVLFTVQLPLWIIAILATLGRSLWASTTKYLFKTLAFLQLTVLWRVIKRRLPKDTLARKRRLDFRIARTVVRQRRMTLRQVEMQKDTLAMRWALLRERWRRSDGDGEDPPAIDASLDAALRQDSP